MQDGERSNLRGTKTAPVQGAHREHRLQPAAGKDFGVFGQHFFFDSDHEDFLHRRISIARRQIGAERTIAPGQFIR